MLQLIDQAGFPKLELRVEEALPPRCGAIFVGVILFVLALQLLPELGLLIGARSAIESLGCQARAATETSAAA